MNTKDIISDYLHASNVPTHLGPVEDALANAILTPTADDRQIVNKLNDNIRLNNNMVIAMYALLIALFIFSLVLVQQFVNKPKELRLLFGGSVFSILVIVWMMRRIWLDKLQSEAILLIIPQLDKAQKLKVVLAYLSGDLKRAFKLGTGQVA